MLISCVLACNALALSRKKKITGHLGHHEGMYDGRVTGGL